MDDLPNAAILLAGYYPERPAPPPPLPDDNPMPALLGWLSRHGKSFASKHFRVPYSTVRAWEQGHIPHEDYWRAVAEATHTKEDAWLRASLRYIKARSEGRTESAKKRYEQRRAAKERKEAEALWRRSYPVGWMRASWRTV